MRVRGSDPFSRCLNTWTGFASGATINCNGANDYDVSWLANTEPSNAYAVFYQQDGGAWVFGGNVAQDQTNIGITPPLPSAVSFGARVEVYDSCGNLVDSSLSGDVGPCL